MHPSEGGKWESDKKRGGSGGNKQTSKIKRDKKTERERERLKEVENKNSICSYSGIVLRR